MFSFRGVKNSMHNTRPSPIAGRWYPDDPKQLADTIDQYVNAAILPDLDGEVVGVMAPHAGLIYSGPVAGYAFAALKGIEPEIVAVVSPMHHPYSQSILTSAHSDYATPLGQVPVDHLILGKLNDRLKEAGVELSPIRNDPEHSLEIELPFLQRVLPEGFRLIPLMVREQTREVAQALGLALASVLQDRPAILVASTDLSHFFSQSVAKDLDTEILRRVESFDPNALFEAEEKGKGYACGHAALAAVLWASKSLGADQARVLHYATSGDVSGDHSQVVGYASAAITRPLPDPSLD
jgi:MEMO1 family protein